MPEPGLPLQYLGYSKMARTSDAAEPGTPYRLKKLTPKHRIVVALHLQGFAAREISEMLGAEGKPITVARIQQVLADPLARTFLSKWHHQTDMELKSLEAKAVSRLRDGLVNPDYRCYLRAADLIFKANNRYAEKDKGDESAEDVIARALTLMNTKAVSPQRRIAVLIEEGVRSNGPPPYDPAHPDHTHSFTPLSDGD